MTTMTEEKLSGTGGAIHLRVWRPAGAPRAVVAIVHGFNSHGGHYLWAADQLVAKGFAVYALDLRGRGLSDGERFYVDKVGDYLSDIDLMMKTVKSRDPGLPVFLLGHSAGGVLSCLYTLDHQADIKGLICESFAYQVPVPGFVLAILKFVGGFLPHTGVFKLKNKDFSRDPAWVAHLNQDQLIANEAQPGSTAVALIGGSETLKVSFPRITLPVLIMHGTEDKATVPAGSQFFFDTVGSKDKTLKLYKDHVHDLLADTGKEGVMADITAWIEARL